MAHGSFVANLVPPENEYVHGDVNEHVYVYVYVYVYVNEHVHGERGRAPHEHD